MVISREIKLQQMSKCIVFFILLCSLCNIANSATLSLRGKTYDLRGNLSDDALKALPYQKEISTKTPWSQGKILTYRGPDLLTLLNQSGLGSSHLYQLNGSNGFSTVIRRETIEALRPIVATEVMCSEDYKMTKQCTSGTYNPLAIVDYGPLFVVWPMDAMRSSLDSSDHSRWVWFLTEIQSID